MRGSSSSTTVMKVFVLRISHKVCKEMYLFGGTMDDLQRQWNARIMLAVI